MMLDGAFPPGRLGELAATQVANEVVSVFELLPEKARHIGAYRSVDIDDLDIEAVNGGSNIVVSGSIENIIDHEIFRVSFTRYREDLLLDPWVDLALLTLIDPDEPWSVRLVARGSKGEGIARSFSLSGMTSEERQSSARKAISIAQTLLTCMARGRVPYLPKTADKIHQSSIEAARSTYEDALLALDAAAPRPGETWLLVTSAWHMPRARRAFEQAGLEVIAAPTGYTSITPSPMAWVPSGQALRNTHIAMREWLGQAWYRLNYAVRG
jgi:hypothetical protein